MGTLCLVNVLHASYAYTAGADTSMLFCLNLFLPLIPSRMLHLVYLGAYASVLRHLICNRNISFDFFVMYFHKKMLFPSSHGSNIHMKMDFFLFGFKPFIISLIPYSYCGNCMLTQAGSSVAYCPPVICTSDSYPVL